MRYHFFRSQYFTPTIIITFLHSLSSLSPSFFLFSFFPLSFRLKLIFLPSWPGSVYYAKKISLSLLPSFFPSPSFFFFTSSSPNLHLKFSSFFLPSHLFIYLTFALSLSFFLSTEIFPHHVGWGLEAVIVFPQRWNGHEVALDGSKHKERDPYKRREGGRGREGKVGGDRIGKSRDGERKKERKRERESVGEKGVKEVQAVLVDKKRKVSAHFSLSLFSFISPFSSS